MLPVLLLLGLILILLLNTTLTTTSTATSPNLVDALVVAAVASEGLGAEVVAQVVLHVVLARRHKGAVRTEQLLLRGNVRPDVNPVLILWQKCRIRPQTPSVTPSVRLLTRVINIEHYVISKKWYEMQRITHAAECNLNCTLTPSGE